MSAALLYVSVGLVLALRLRKPAQRVFGAGTAFTLWLLPPVLAARPWLPTPPASWLLTPTLLVVPATHSLIDHATFSASGPHWLSVVWLIGALALLARLAVCYGRLLGRTEALRTP